MRTLYQISLSLKPGQAIDLSHCDIMEDVNRNFRNPLDRPRSSDIPQHIENIESAWGVEMHQDSLSQRWKMYKLNK